MSLLQKIAAVLLKPVFLAFAFSAFTVAVIAYALAMPAVFILWLTTTPEEFEEHKKSFFQTPEQ